MSDRALHPPTTARELRAATTDAERRLWSILRDRQLSGCKLRRQHPIGPFFADFACVERMLVIEADGGQHADNDADDRRTAWLESQGWRVIRFWNNEILGNWRAAVAVPPDPHPPAQSGGPLPLPQAGEGI